ncbi:hypothetical protein [Pelotalea chapellei]|uniref:YkgJ family cysteine cluster protein n=1 Tax=Pelotalea chapellei TaxID=44671 RepID=A0ABS5U8V9_9BACT|nr:hypothetical protein [Pelotalea chapellei]MBT1072076.1 hypothetical protein [Pelotalea chapellei]
MDDRQSWHKAQVSAWECYERLSADRREQLDCLMGRIMLLKEQLLNLALTAGSRLICRDCGGKCCLYGKYHVTVLDLIINRKHSAEPLAPDFSTYPFCPYGSADGCCFTPRLRPLTCVIFNCELLEDRLDEHARHQAAMCERELREACAEAEMIAESRLTRSALLSYGD